MNKLLVAGLGAGAYLAYQKFKNIKLAASQLSYQVKNINLNSLNLQTTGLGLTLEITNPTNQNFSFQQLTGSLTLGSSKLLSFQSVANVSIAANSITPVQMQVMADNHAAFSNLGQTALSLLTGAGQPLMLNLVVRINGINIPIQQNVKDFFNVSN